MTETRSKFTALAPAALATVVAIATFDPYLANFELASFVITTYLPELSLLLMLFIGLAFYRSGGFDLVYKHKVISLFLIALVALPVAGITRGMAEEASREQRADLRIFKYELTGPLWDWALNRPSTYFTDFGSRFGQDMLIRSVSSFEDEDFEAAKGYLSAASRYGDERSAREAGASLDYLRSRALYLENHEARIESLLINQPLSPLLGYLLRAHEQLATGEEGQSARYREYANRVTQAEPVAARALSECLDDGSTFILNENEVEILRHTFAVIGELPLPDAGRNDVNWCDRLRNIVEDRKIDNLSDLFSTKVELLWGEV